MSVGIDGSRAEDPRQGGQGHDHARGADEQQRLASDAVDERDGDDREQHVDAGGDERCLEGLGLGESHGLPDGVGVVEDRIDADELLECAEHDADPDNGHQSQRAPADVREARLVVPLERLLDVVDHGRHVDGVDGAEHLGGLGWLADGDEVPRGFGDAQHEQGVDHRRDHHAEEHPLPRLQAEQPGVARVAAGGLQDEVVDQPGGEDADDDRELLEGTHAAANRRGGDLGDVHRCHHARHADAGSADEAPQHEIRDSDGEGLPDGRDEEERSRDQHDAATPVAVGKRTGEPRADGRADESNRDDETDRDVAEPEEGLDRRRGPVDDGGVIAEEEAAEGRGRGQSHHPSGAVVLDGCRGAHRASLIAPGGRKARA